MATKLLCVIVLISTFVYVLASCNFIKHTHNYGEWEITKSATCTAEGSKERYCSCGEKQTAEISSLEHSMTNGICNICGFENSTNNDENFPNQTVKKEEWITLFDSNKYQSYLMKIVGSEITQVGYTDTFEIAVQFKNPYFKIVSLETEGVDEADGWLNRDESTAFIFGGVEELEKTVYIPHNISSFYETISKLDDLGYSKFIFNADHNTYSSNLFDGFESVEISISNNTLDTIVLTKEYCDYDWGDKTEIYTLKLSDINTTPKPEIPKEEVYNYITEAKDSINDAIETREFYQSLEMYDIDEAISIFNSFLNDLISQNNGIKRFEFSKYSWTNYEFDEYEEETNIDIILTCPETRYVTILSQNVNYDEINLGIENNKITTVQLYSKSSLAFSIYFFYED